jgi:hypothetical protein
MYNTIIKSTVLYGSVIWRWTKAEKRRLGALETDSPLRTCGISGMEMMMMMMMIIIIIIIQWHYSPDGHKPPLIRFRSLS